MSTFRQGIDSCLVFRFHISFHGKVHEILRNTAFILHQQYRFVFVLQISYQFPLKDSRNITQFLLHQQYRFVFVLQISYQFPLKDSRNITQFLLHQQYRIVFVLQISYQFPLKDSRNITQYSISSPLAVTEEQLSISTSIFTYFLLVFKGHTTFMPNYGQNALCKHHNDNKKILK